MQALFAIVTVILALVGPGRLRTPKGVTSSRVFPGTRPTSRDGLPRLPSVPRLPPAPTAQVRR
jgi:hypothetical protein